MNCLLIDYLLLYYRKLICLSMLTYQNAQAGKSKLILKHSLCARLRGETTNRQYTTMRLFYFLFE